MAQCIHSNYYNPPHDGGGILWFHVGIRVSFRPSVRQSVHPSIPSFCLTSVCIFVSGRVYINECSPVSVCALILWKSGLGLLKDNFHEFLQSYLPATCPYFRFRTITWDNINEFSPILVYTLILCRSGLILLVNLLQSYLPATHPYFHFRIIIWINLNGFFTNQDTCIYNVDIWFGFDNVQIYHRIISPRHDHGGVLSFHVFISIFAQSHEHIFLITILMIVRM